MSQDEQEFNQEVEEVFFEEETLVEEPQGEDTDWKAEAEKAKAETLKYKAILERKTKKEAEPTKSAQEQTNPAPIPTTDVVTPKDLLRTTKGYDDDALNQLEVIAKGKGISLIEAQNDALFTSYIEKTDADKKAQSAKLGSSKGSGKSSERKTFNSQGLSAEEHKAMWKDKQGN